MVQKILERMRLWLILFAIVLAGISTIIMINNYQNDKRYQTEYQENQKIYDDLVEKEEQMLDDANPEERETYSAAINGAAVATLQTQYNNNMQTEDEVIEKLKMYFSDTAYIWYPHQFGNNDDITWTFMTTWMQEDDPNINSVWICRDNIYDDILAYVVAIYDANAETFSDVKVTETPKGQAYYNIGD